MIPRAVANLTFIANKNLTFIVKVSMTFIEKIHTSCPQSLAGRRCVVAFELRGIPDFKQLEYPQAENYSLDLCD
ncbi:MAG: hypothetical protein DKT66_23300 [Candidatus Melainabacteria bacterium]|nr:MAG: hypothetical protein DKT66_23300 [Candidatus Melainabacteria bacterium]